MMSRKGIRAEILETLEELENTKKMTAKYFILGGRLKAFCEVLDGDLFARVNEAGDRFLNEDYRARIERFIVLD